MKIISSLFVVFTFLVFNQTLFSQTESIKFLGGFRSAKWDESKEQIYTKETESEAATSKDGDFETAIFYTSDFKPNESGTLIYYNFQNNKFVRGGYYFHLGNNVNEETFKNYSNKKKELVSNYGIPNIDTTFFKEKVDKNNLLSDIDNGNATLVTHWFFSDGMITLRLSKNNPQMKLEYSLFYLSRDYINSVSDK